MALGDGREYPNFSGSETGLGTGHDKGESSQQSPQTCSPYQHPLLGRQPQQKLL